ncbi:Endothelial lipase [Orchesella cincta]|uniref:Endothelial lipase n=1 Tax=Orchesella cincta TaxID=48709 RepID=A0A1D2NKL3_ORCCI|nr:Endothelial lipase [Orchesella cincta]
MISKLVRRRVFVVAVVFFSQSMFRCATCHANIGATTDQSKDSRHIEWISGSTSVSNYTSACDDAPDLFACFSEWDKRTVFFYLYNRGRNGSEILRLGDLDQLERSTFNRFAPVKIIIHGYKMNGFSPFSHLIKEAYLKHGNETNVIVVDWKWLAGHHIYFNSAFNTRIVGERVGEFIVYLRKTKFIKTFKSVHLIGFSLGAHVAGYAAKHVKKVAKIRIDRITGLDPAGPSFSGSKANLRLDNSDARFVDVIHTCVGRSGISESIGHVDFYPNGGIDQPGCEWERLHSFFLKNCSHERSYHFFLESIKGEKFVACSCPKWEEFQTGNCRCNENTPGAELMGEYCSDEATGDKYLATTYDNHYSAA